VLFLKDLPLFNRIVAREDVSAVKATEDIRQLIPNLKVQEMREDQIVFCQPQFVHIIINGRVVLRYHE